MENSKSPRIVRAITEDGSAWVMFEEATEIVREAVAIHDTSPTMAAAMGRLLIGASIMGSTLKNKNATLTLRVSGDGPAGTITCVSDASGYVRGYAENPLAEPPRKPNGKLNVSEAVGAGALYVIRDSGEGEPYVGSSPLVTGEIAEDITEYYMQSEQTATVCSLGVRITRDGVLAAGGFLVQLLPYPDETVVDQLEKNMQNFPSVSGLLAEGKTAEDIIELIFADIPHNLLDEREVGLRCNCSSERFEKGLASLSKKDLLELAEEGEPIETVCRFCRKAYHFSPETLIKLANRK